LRQKVNKLFEIKLQVRAKKAFAKPDELIGHLVDVSAKGVESLFRGRRAFEQAHAYSIVRQGNVLGDRQMRQECELLMNDRNLRASLGLAPFAPLTVKEVDLSIVPRRRPG
jgi:hypothetical protein